jgi:hypothetical protein
MDSPFPPPFGVNRGLTTGELSGNALVVAAKRGRLRAIRRTDHFADVGDAPSDAHDPVELLDHARELGWCDPPRLHPLEVFVGRPTGDRASLSDVNRNVVVEELLQEIARRRDPNALNAFGSLL